MKRKTKTDTIAMMRERLRLIMDLAKARNRHGYETALSQIAAIAQNTIDRSMAT